MEVSEKHGDKLKIVIGLLLFFIPVVLYSLQIPFYQNCLSLTKWLLIYAAIGGIIGAGMAVYLLLKREETEDFQGFQIVIAGLVLGILLAPLLATIINRATAINNVTQERVEVVSVHGFNQSRFGSIGEETGPDGFYIYVLYSNEVIRLQTKSTADLKSISEGDQTDIHIHHGALGLKWVTLLFSSDSI